MKLFFGQIVSFSLDKLFAQISTWNCPPEMFNWDREKTSFFLSSFCQEKNLLIKLFFVFVKSTFHKQSGKCWKTSLKIFLKKKVFLENKILKTKTELVYNLQSTYYTHLCFFCFFVYVDLWFWHQITYTNIAS